MKKLKSKFKKLSKTKKIISLSLIFILIFFTYKQFSSADNEITYQTQTVEKGTVTSLVSDTGEILTTGTAQVESTITGLVSDIYIQNGDTITAGQKLFSVTSTASSADKSLAYSTYLKAKTTLESAQNTLLTLESKMWSAHEEYKRIGWDKEWDDPTYIQTNRDWLAAESDYQNQQQVITQAQASLTSAWYDYQAVAGGTVTAPLAGTASNLSLTPGQQISAGDIALMINNQADLWAKLTVSENDVNQIQVDQKADVYVDALDELKLEGTVDHFDDIGTDTSGIVTYNVYLNLGQVDANVKPGMTVQIDVVTASAKDVLIIPNSALKTYQGISSVQILDEDSGQPLYLPVKTGIVGDSYTQITDGLSQGQEIIISQSSSSSDSQSSSLFPGGGMMR